MGALSMEEVHIANEWHIGASEKKAQLQHV
jgi:hypothetical protein